MEKTRQRAWRRHHFRRIKAKRRDYYGKLALQFEGKERERRLGRLIHTATPCSCWMCGNPRRHGEGQTLAERRADELRTAARTLNNENG